MSARGFTIVALLLLVLLAFGTTSTSTKRIVVRVGEVAEVDVDYKIGFACDDVTILRARMETRGEHNWFVVEGVAVGRTWCRVGTDPNLRSYLFEVIVDPPSRRRT